MLHTKKYINNNGSSKLKTLRKTLKGGAQVQTGAQVKVNTAVQGKLRPLPRQRGVARRGPPLGGKSALNILQGATRTGVIGNEDESSSNNEGLSYSTRQRILRQPARQLAREEVNNSSNNDFDVESLLPDPKTLPQDTKLKQLKVAMIEFSRITQDISRKIENINQRIQ